MAYYFNYLHVKHVISVLVKVHLTRNVHGVIEVSPIMELMVRMLLIDLKPLDLMFA